MVMTAPRVRHLLFASLLLVPLLAACDTTRPIVPLNGGGGAGGATAATTTDATSTSSTSSGGTGGAPDAGP